LNSAKPDASTDKANVAEPPEIRQLRVQIHQYELAIAQATQQQAKLQQQIKMYEGRVASSPAIEEQYKQLTRDYDTAQKFYDDLLIKRNDSAMTTDMERQQQGQQFRLLNAASLPGEPSFPNRLLFAGGGLGLGLALGVGLAFWMEISDKAIRSEADVEAIMELPMLISLPWVGDKESRQEGESDKGLRQPRDADKEAVGV
jgi:protein tyrosine kinase modulator